MTPEEEAREKQFWIDFYDGKWTPDLEKSWQLAKTIEFVTVPAGSLPAPSGDAIICGGCPCGCQED